MTVTPSLTLSLTDSLCDSESDTVTVTDSVILTFSQLLTYCHSSPVMSDSHSDMNCDRLRVRDTRNRLVLVCVN